MRAWAREPRFPSAPAQALALCVLLTAARPASAFERTLTCDTEGPLQCDPGQVPVPLRWTLSCIDIYFNPLNAGRITNPVDVTEAVARSIAAWDEIPESQLRLRYAGTTSEDRVGYAASCNDNINAIMLVTDQWEGRPGAQPNVVALTSVTYDFSTGAILDADIEMNLAIFAWRLFPTTELFASEHDLQSTLTHELGHFIGLDHTQPDTFTGSADESWESTTMYARTLPGQIAKRTLERDDINGALAAYGPGTSSPGPCPPPGPEFRPTPLSTPGQRCLPQPGIGCTAGPSPLRSRHVFAIALASLLLRVRRPHARPRTPHRS